MELLDLGQLDGRSIERYESEGARHLGAARIAGSGGVSVIDIEADGVLGGHDAVVDQLFVVIGGEGWVCGADGHRCSIRAGQAALWTAGESHESGTDLGMTLRRQHHRGRCGRVRSHGGRVRVRGGRAEVLGHLRAAAARGVA